jgi:hypothetical protein
MIQVRFFDKMFDGTPFTSQWFNMTYHKTLEEAQDTLRNDMGEIRTSMIGVQYEFRVI